jgi:hypothetical protein
VALYSGSAYQRYSRRAKRRVAKTVRRTRKRLHV